MNLYKRLNGVWWVNLTSFDENGKRLRLRKTTGQTNKRDAEVIALKIQTEWLQYDKAVQNNITLEELFDNVITHRETMRSGATVEYYRGRFKMILEWFGKDFKAVDISARKVTEFIAARKKGEVGASKRKVSTHTVHKELQAIRAALKLAKSEGTWDGDIENIIPVGESPQYKPKTTFCTPDELKDLMKELEPRTNPLTGAVTPDRSPVIAWIVATSARWSEAINAQPDDVYRLQGRRKFPVTKENLYVPGQIYVDIRGTKTEGAARTVPIVADWQQKLVQYVILRDGLPFKHWNVQNANHELAKACKRLRIAPSVTPNDLRRTHASWLVQAEVPLKTVADMMGHKTTTMVELVYGRRSAEHIAASVAQALSKAPVVQELDIDPEKGLLSKPVHKKKPLLPSGKV